MMNKKSKITKLQCQDVAVAVNWFLCRFNISAIVHCLHVMSCTPIYKKQRRTNAAVNIYLLLRLRRFHDGETTEHAQKTSAKNFQIMNPSLHLKESCSYRSCSSITWYYHTKFQLNQMNTVRCQSIWDFKWRAQTAPTGEIEKDAERLCGMMSSITPPSFSSIG